MKTLFTRITGVLTLTLFLALFGCNSSTSGSNETDAASPSTDIGRETILELPSDSLSAEETNGLYYMREEEKLARDVYIVLYQTWGQRVFNNISNSEQMHTDAIKTLIEKYSLTDPVTNDSVGVFQNETLQGLFYQLTDTGKVSLINALKVGALIEEIDILDLQKELDEFVDNEDITYVYENLMRGSRNHLRAFVRNLAMQGVTYTPVKLDQDTYNAIIESGWETGHK